MFSRWYKNYNLL